MLEKSGRSLEKHSLGLIASLISVDKAKTSNLNTRVGEEFMAATQTPEVTDETTLPNPNSSLPIRL